MPGHDEALDVKPCTILFRGSPERPVSSIRALLISAFLEWRDILADDHRVIRDDLEVHVEVERPIVGNRVGDDGVLAAHVLLPDRSDLFGQRVRLGSSWSSST